MFAKNKKGKDKPAEEDTKKKEEEEAARKKAEEEAAAEATRKAEAEAQAAAEARKRAEEAAAADASKKKAEAEAAAKKKAEAEAAAASAGQKKAEEEAAAAARKAEEAKRAKEEAERKAIEDAERREQMRKKAEEARSQQRWLGASVPKGVEGASMAMGSLYDMKVAFAMLDKRGRGHLDRKQARNFCRCAGWIVPDQQLDLMLDGALGSVAKLLGTGGTRTADANKTFKFEELCDILEKNTKASNGAIKDVTDALTRLASQNAQIRRHRFQEVVMQAPDFTEGDVELILQMVGLQRASDMDCNNLGTRLVTTVVTPPSMFEAHAAKQKEQTASSPLSLYRSAARSKAVS